MTDDIDQLVAATKAAPAEDKPFDPAAYETVAQRVKKFWAKHPEGRISTEVVNTTGGIGETRWVVRASVWTNRWEDRDMTIKRIEPDATGIAVEVDSDEGVNATSACENAETSALGRALANLGFAGDKRPSREEMQKTTRRRRPRRPKTTTQVRTEAEG
jgi:hypothetical protein